MSDPWEEIPVTYVGTVPRWMVDLKREEYDDPNLTAHDLVAMWVDNMQENTYDCARDDGVLPVPTFIEGEDMTAIPNSTKEIQP